MYRVKALFFFPLVTATLAQDIQGWRFFSREDSNKNNDEIIIIKNRCRCRRLCGVR